MKLFRAMCPCGYRTQKARVGYHHYKWWFPVFQLKTSTLFDVEAALPDDQRKRIDQQQIDLYQTPRDRIASRREVSGQVRAFHDEVCSEFINRAERELELLYNSDELCHFDPCVGTSFLCPRCKGQSLTLKQASVFAYCKTDCGHSYPWLDSEISGCSKCGHRPHRFSMEYETGFSDQCRAVGCCPCSSSTDCISHQDGYCPKCGELPDSYRIGEIDFCGRHHERLIDYQCPANFLFIETDSRWVMHQFPNAKSWGDAKAGSDCIVIGYCKSCESDHLRWLAARSDDE